MIQNKNHNILYTQMQIIYLAMKWLIFYQQKDSNRQILIKIKKQQQQFKKVCFRNEYPKELRELNNDYLLAPLKIEIEKEILSNYQLKIADFYNVPIGIVKKLVPNVFDKKV